MSFGSKLKQYRPSKDLSQEQLANILETTKQVVSRYENEQRSPRLSVAIDIANKLNIPLETLIDDSCELSSKTTHQQNNKPVITNELSEDKLFILELLNSMDDEQIKAARSYLEFLIDRGN